jgi:hypothetical protein
MINREVFFTGYKNKFLKAGGSLNQSQVDGLNFILNKLDESKILNRARHYAYILATIYHECAVKWQPIQEMGSQRYLLSKKYYPWIGRGYVQLTWIFNYTAMKPIVEQFLPHVDILRHPDSAMDPEAAWIILEAGMTKADIGPLKEPNFVPGHTLERYFNDSITDWVNARRIINGKDCANLIGGYAKKFYDCIEFVDEETVIKTNGEGTEFTEPDANEAIAELEKHEGELAEAMKSDTSLT